MKKFLLLSGILLSSVSFAQLNRVNSELSKTAIQNNDTVDGWKKGGTFSLLFNQSAFSNWVAGGTNNVAGNANINYDLNYKKGAWTWDNKFILAYGLSKNEGQEFRKTDDRLEINSLLGRKAFNNWSYSFFANFRTQFTDGNDYNRANYEDYPTSGFMKPAYLTFGPGLMYKKNDNFKFNLAPLTSKLTVLSGKVYTWDGTQFRSSDEVETFGVKAGESTRYELGFYAAGYYKVQLMDNVSMENILGLYSNYLDNPQNIDLDYTMNLVMKINKYLSTNLTVQTLYDDNAYKGLQVREVFGLGFNLNF
ncbi:DUF3078 domain-containing protein [Ornithobacterium rhinotracheale]|uniref:DUF3078 domain-containing protein n=1 Tax=Ornithobacterium rhinotracheale TaxID=28251 RepID=A0A410JPR5_ORNRH|nr:DUF3078 domain-containing protein [Ornithobacterium rhinotracheale]QAR30038.1 DUF3078 domain-containing protein [Ornithobacterium rhinotracheale]